jgi:hypothetical protein
VCSVRQVDSGPSALPALLFVALPSSRVQREAPPQVSAVLEAVGFLRALLASGPLPAREVQRRARSAGVSTAALRRAKGRLEVASVKAGLTGGWVWSLPPSKVSTPPREDGQGDLRGDVLALARLAGYPAVQFGPGETIPEGEASWRAFARGAGEGDLAAAWSALVRRLP